MADPARSPRAAGRAVILTPDLDGAAGGVETFSHLIAGILEGRGWQVDLVTPSPAPSWARHLGARYAWDGISSMRAADRAQPDLFVSNGFLGAPLPGRRRVHVFHGCMVEFVRRSGSDLRWHDRWRRIGGGGVAEAVAGRGARTVAVSQSVAREVRRFYRLSVDAVIANGVDTSIFRPADRAAARMSFDVPAASRQALFVGRWEHRKGLEHAVAASRAAGYDLMVAGSGPFPPGLRTLGPLPPRRLALAYAAADCVLAPSLYEACAFVPMESLAVGTPVITTAVGSIPELVAAVPAYGPLVVDAHPSALATAMGRLSEAGVQRAVRMAHDHVVRHHSLEAFTAAWETFLVRA